MTTDPGDLVLDPTCGTGTTAFVAEQWGRRWITIDTSRVALALARTRLMARSASRTTCWPTRRTAQRRRRSSPATPVATGRSTNDIRKGFVYERVPHITLKSIAHNPDIERGHDAARRSTRRSRGTPSTELLYDQPYEDRKNVRVAARSRSRACRRTASLDADGRRPRREDARGVDATSTSSRRSSSNLRKAGVQKRSASERLEFDTLEPYAGHVHPGARATFTDADGDAAARRHLARPGVRHGRLRPGQGGGQGGGQGRGLRPAARLRLRLRPARRETAKEFAPESSDGFAVAAEERKLGRLPVLLVRMNPDLAMGEEL